MQDTLEQTPPIEIQSANEGEVMKPKKIPKAKTGKRYTPEQRQAIVEYVKSIGRGGMVAAARKFSVSMLSVSRFLKEAGVAVGKKKTEQSRRASAKIQKGNPRNRYTLAQKREILKYAGSIGKGGVDAAIEKYGVGSTTISRFKRELGIPPSKAAMRYTPVQKREILEFAVSNGIAEAVQKYGVAKNSIKAFRRELGKSLGGRKQKVVKVDPSISAVSNRIEVAPSKFSGRKKKKILRGITGLLQSLQTLAEAVLEDK